MKWKETRVDRLQKTHNSIKQWDRWLFPQVESVYFGFLRSASYWQRNEKKRLQHQLGQTSSSVHTWPEIHSWGRTKQKQQNMFSRSTLDQRAVGSRFPQSALDFRKQPWLTKAAPFWLRLFELEIWSHTEGPPVVRGSRFSYKCFKLLDSKGLMLAMQSI